MPPWRNWAARRPASSSGSPGDFSREDTAIRVAPAHPDVDILVNNLGIFQPVPFEEISDDDWRRLFEVNVLSGVRLSRLYLPHMKRFVNQLASKEAKSFDEFEKEFFQSVRPTSLIKRFATSEEVASLVAYVASPLASATTGAALRVDGGTVRSAF
jgi:NAD(P)-dependent dehydrogenase (short-subunit alcohol dehydrogenase family)